MCRVYHGVPDDAPEKNLVLVIFNCIFEFFEKTGIYCTKRINKCLEFFPKVWYIPIFFSTCLGLSSVGVSIEKF